MAEYEIREAKKLIESLEKKLAEKQKQLEKVEKKSREEESNLFSLFSLMDQIILEVDYDGKYLFVAPTAMNLLVAPPEEVVGKTIYDFFPKEQADIFLNFIRSSIDSNEKKTIKYSVKINGEEKWFFGKATPKANKTALFIARDITEEKHREDELKAANQQLTAYNQQLSALEQQLRANEETIMQQNKYLKALIESGSNIINLIDENGNFIYLTPSHKKLFGYELDERLQKPFYENIHPKDKERLLDELETLKKNPDKAIDFSCRIKHKKGHYVHIQGEARNLLGNDIVNAIVISYIDVTDKLQSQEKIKRLSSVIKTTNQSVVITKLDGEVIYVNKAYLNKSGFNKEEVIGRSMFDFTSEKGVEILKYQVVPALLSEGNWKGEMAVKNKDNSYYPTYLRCNIMKDENGEPEYFVAVFDDISERKKTEAELLKFYTAINQNPSIIMITDSRDRIEFVNPAFTEITSYTLEEVKGKHTKLLNSGTHDKEFFNDLWKTITSGKVWRGEIHNRKKNGETFWESAIISPVTDAEGNITNFIKVAQDITEQKYDEQVKRVIFDVSNAVISAVDLREFLKIVKKELSTIIDTTNFYVAIYDKENDSFTLPYFADQFDDIQSFPAQQTLTGYLIGKKKALLLHEKEIREMAAKDIIKATGTISKVWLGVPLVVKRKVIGAMVVQSYENAHAFGQKEKELLEIISHNISLSIEKIRAEETHKENEYRFKALSDATYEAIFISENGYCIEANEAACRMYGYDYEELIGIFGTDLIAPESKELVKKNMLSGYEKPYEAISMRKDGSKFPTEFEGRMFKYKGRNVRITAARDITRRKENERLLQKQLDYIRFVNDISVGFINIDSSKIEDSLGDLIRVTAEFTGMDKAGVYILSDDKKSMELKYSWINPNLDNGDSFVNIFTNEYCDKMMEKFSCGDELVLLKASQIIDTIDSAELIEFLKTRKDAFYILSRFQIAGDLTVLLTFSSYENLDKIDDEVKYGINLCRLIIANTFDKKHTDYELIKAKEKAEESDRLKTAFLSNMSHEIRTPMNGILGFINLLKNTDISSSEREEFTKIIEKSSKRLLNTINDLIDISKIEAGQINIVKKAVNVNNLIDELYEFFTPEAEEKHLNLIKVCPIGNNNSIVITDEDKLHGILTNLIKNAIKFTNKGRITFGYKLRKDSFLEFFVKDTGKGIPPERIEAVFNRFEQADFDSNRGYEGSGLGLAISKAYVEYLGGEIKVSSRLGEGSKFTFTIPYKTSSETKKPEKLAAPKAKGSGKKHVFLVAEDEDVSFIFMEILLKNHAGKIIRARNGVEAVNIYKEKRDEIDIILMDMKMPEMDGYEATRRIRQFDKDVVIIAQTAYALLGDKEKVLEAGCTDYISKPIEREKLLKMIEKYLY